MDFPDFPRFKIGQDNWLREVRSLTEKFDRHFWDGFSPCTDGEIAICEQEIKRQLPADLREFLLRIGAGEFVTTEGYIYTPEEIVLASPGPLIHVLGRPNMVSDEDLRLFHASRGSHNPSPGHFTRETPIHDCQNLFDFVQVGSNGQCCYHLLNVAPSAQSFGYCLLEADGAFVDRLPSFSEALRHILILAWRDSQGLDDVEPGLDTGFRIDSN